jgi:hypothetical protein
MKGSNRLRVMDGGSDHRGIARRRIGAARLTSHGFVLSWGDAPARAGGQMPSSFLLLS